MRFNEEKLLFEYSDSIIYKIALVFITLIGLALLASGIFAFKYAPYSPFILVGIGLFMSSAGMIGFHGIKKNKELKTSSVFFDNKSHNFVIQNISSEKFEIPYSEIEAFTIITYISNNSGHNTGNHRFIQYKVCVNLIDGSKWELYRANNKNTADEILNALTTKVELNKTAKDTIKHSILPENVLNAKNGVFEWENKKTSFEIFSLISLLGGVAMIGFGFALSESTGHSPKILLFGIVAVFLMIFFLIINGSQAKYNIAIKDSNISYNKKKYFSKNWKNKNFPLNELAKVRFSFSLGEDNSLNKNQINILTKSAAEKLSNFEDNKESGLMNAFSLMKELISNIIVVETYNFKIVDILKFKYVIQSEIDKKSHSN